MKAFGRIYRRVIIAIVIQVVTLAYFNFIYLPGRNYVTATRHGLSERGAMSREIKIPADVKNVKVSYDGSYIAYMNDEKLEIINTLQKQDKKTIDPGKAHITFYRWLPDRNMVIYATRFSNAKKGLVRISTYDMDSGLERSYPDIKELPYGSEATHIEASPFTNVVYIKIKVSQTYSRIYKFDIMDYLRQIIKIGADVVFRETYYNDNLIYNDADGRLYIMNGSNGKTRQLWPKSKIVLLGVDLKDNIYIGELNKDDMVSAIFHGNAGTGDIEWKSIKLEEPLSVDEIVISPGGRLFKLLEEREGKGGIISLDGMEEYYFSGSFEQMLEEYIVARDGDRLKIIALKEDKPGLRDFIADVVDRVHIVFKNFLSFIS